IMNCKKLSPVIPLPLVKLKVILLALIATSLLFPLEAKEGLSGMVYYKWVYPVDPAPDEYNEFSFDRIYVTYEKQLWDGIKVILVTDIKNTAGVWAARQKNAYLDYKTGAGSLLIGMQGMNLFNVIKDNWGYRFLAKSSMNEHKWASSADFGLGYKVTVAGKAHLHFTVTNGTGFDKKESDKYKKIAAQAVYGTKKLGMKPGFNVGLAGTMEPYEPTDTTTATKTVMAVFGGLTLKSTIRVGGEFDREMDNGEDITRQIIAAYFDLRVRGIPRLNINIFGRAESYDPDLGTAEDGELIMMIGAKIFPIKAFNIAPNLRYSIPEAGDSDVTALQLNFEFKY
ncbi:MAG: hypothetical protein KAU50_05425, partial [Candidatus Marinimicrobia bacterium]|nr:hypothetical protein [Candidatus Neomarinimicrobiota bacterium]